MMVVGEKGKTPNIIQGEAGNQSTVEEVKVDKRQGLWDELDKLEIPYKKNMSKSKLEALLEE